MKIVYDAQIFRRQRFGGISRYFCEVGSRIARTPGAWARIVAPEHNNEYLRYVPPRTLWGWKAQRRGKLNGVAALASSALARAALAAVRPDVLHATYYVDDWAAPARTARVLTIYDMIHERYPALFDPQDTTSRDKRRAAERADHVICISESTRQDVIQMLDLDPSKVSVVHLAAALRPAALAADVPGAPYLLYVGLRGGYKNFLGMVNAMAHSPMLRTLQIVCFGGGALTPAECAKIDASGFPRSQIILRGGGDDELAALYAGALCFVYPSLYEGFGIPPLEAMLCDCPVACSDSSSMPEVVQDAGAYFDPTDVDSMRSVLELLVSAPTRCAELRTRGRQVVGRYSWDRCAAETLSTYYRVTSTTAPS